MENRDGSTSAKKALSNMATIQSIAIKYIIEINENKIFKNKQTIYLTFIAKHSQLLRI